MTVNGKTRVHIKNNHASPDTFPPTIEGEAVFTITPERYQAAAERHPDVADHLDVLIDWDTDRFAESMVTAEALVTWDLPTEGLANVAPHLKWIHIIGAGVEHLCPMDWVPDGVTVVNNKGAHAAKAGEFALMAVLMLHNKLPAIATNQRRAAWTSLYSTPIAGKTALIVGVGSLGGGAAHQLKKLGIKVLGVSRHGRPHPDVDEMATTDRLDEMLARADYVFVATPSTPETQNLFDRERLERMKPGCRHRQCRPAPPSWIMTRSLICSKAGTFPAPSSTFSIPNRCLRIRHCGRRPTWSSPRTSRPMTAIATFRSPSIFSLRTCAATWPTSRCKTSSTRCSATRCKEVPP